MPSRLTAVLFDLGGVLVTDIWEPLQDWLSVQYGLAQTDLDAFRKVVWGEEFACKPDHKDETVLYDRLIRHFGIPITPGELAGHSGSFVRPIPGMMDILRDMKRRGFTLGICSNNTEFWYARQRDALDLERVVDPRRIVLSCRVGKKKADSKIFQEAVAAVQTDAAACVFVDDRIKNVEAAAALGMTAVHLPDEIPFDAKQEHLRRQLAGIGLA